MKNSELWQLGGDPNAPTSRSMQSLCWECRLKPNKGAKSDDASVIAEAYEVVRAYEASHSGS
jgi:hypothetical protein